MVGQTISHYEILEQLGSGGMGVVYKARDTKLDRILALKFLPAKVAKDEEAKQRFMQEAKAASSLDDPHICTIYEIGEADDGQLFIAMAYYDGSTLQDLIEKRRIKIDDAASIARQMAKGLSTAHEAGIVHRDVKPANVMVTRKGLAKLLDFGVAKLGQSSDLTREGSTIGTASYMSPEQARGEQVDARSDIWSIGAVLYQMLTGARPFGGGYEAAVAYSIINEEPPPIAPARPDTPEGLVEVVNKALSKNAEERFPTARALADALAEYSGETIVETAPQPAYRPTTAAAADVPSVQKLVVRFAIGGAAALAVVYAAMIGLGLPDWVFPAAVFLTLVGLPITLYGASLEKKRAEMDSAEREGLSGLQKSFNTKKALRGGMIAAATLIVAILGYSGLRAAGVGPFASLITAGVLEEDGVLIVADMENSTDIENLGQTVAEALRVDLSQSTAINVMDGPQIRTWLERMQENPDTILSAGLGLRIAERAGAKAIIEGEVVPIGEAVQITARVVSSSGGGQLASFRESAKSVEEVIDAIDRLSANLREKIGESLTTIRSEPPLPQFTTSSIEALRYLAEAQALQGASKRNEAREAVLKAIEIDSTFGMAHRKAEILQIYPDEDRTHHIRKAFEYKDKMSEQERLLTEGTYYERYFPELDLDKAIEAYEAVLVKWPNNTTALNNLSGIYTRRGLYDKAVPLAEKAATVRESVTYRYNLVRALIGNQELEGALVALDELTSLYPTFTTGPGMRSIIAFSLDSLDAAMRWAAYRDSLARIDDDDQTWVAVTAEQDILKARGRFEEAKRLYTDWMQTDDYEEYRIREALTDSAEQAQRRINAMRVDMDFFALTEDWDAIDSLIVERRMMFSDVTREEANAEVNPDGVLSFRLNSLFWRALDTGNVGAADSLLSRMKMLIETGEAEAPSNWDERVADMGRTLRIYQNRDAEAYERMQAEDEWDASNDRYRQYYNGRAFDVMGDIDRAIAAYTKSVTLLDIGAASSDRGMVAKTHFRLGELYEEKGDPDMAIHHYQKMVDRWKNADAILQPQVEEARRRIDQLLDQKAQEPS